MTVWRTCAFGASDWVPSYSLPDAAPPGPTLRPDRGAGRLLRAGVFALVSVALAVAAHRLAGGRVPSGALRPSAAALLGLGWLLARRERGRICVGAVVLGTQLLLHAAFMFPPLVAAARGGASGRSSRATLAEMFFCHNANMRPSAAQLRTVTRGIRLPTVPTSSTGMSVGHLIVSAAPMTAAHLAAACVVAWWLHRGERACWSAAGRVVLLLSAADQPLPREERVRITMPTSRVPDLGRGCAALFRRRGPPAIGPLVQPV